MQSTLTKLLKKSKFTTITINPLGLKTFGKPKIFYRNMYRTSALQCRNPNSVKTRRQAQTDPWSKPRPHILTRHPDDQGAEKYYCLKRSSSTTPTWSSG